MITANNYSQATSSVNWSSAPPAIKSGHEQFNDLREFYNDDEEIKQTIDLYLEKLNQWVSTSTGKKQNAQAKTEKVKVPERIAKKSVPSAKPAPTPKKVVVKKAAKKSNSKKTPSKPIATKPVKSSKVKTPELNLIQTFIGLNRRSISVKSFEAKLEAAKHLETVNHKPVIDEIKSKLQIAINAAKADANSNGKITATINPEFIKKCKETIANAKELLRVSYIGQITTVRPGVKPSKKLRPVKYRTNTYTDATGRGAGSHHGGLKKKR